jgi:hypothetical protein
VGETGVIGALLMCSGDFRIAIAAVLIFTAVVDRLSLIDVAIIRLFCGVFGSSGLSETFLDEVWAVRSSISR